MGNPVKKNHEDEISDKITTLKQKLDWYITYLKSDFKIPDGDDHVNFVSRNIDLVNSIENLTKHIETLQKCIDKNEYIFSDQELEIKILQSMIVAKYLGIY